MVVAIAFLLAAATGALARALIGRTLNAAFPWGTWAVNVTGSFVLGLVAHGSAVVATVVGTGLLGTYTTFSSYARDAVALWEREQRSAAVIYVVSTVVACISAAWVGLLLLD